MGRAPGIALVLHPRRDPGPVLDAVGAWAMSHGSRLLMRPAVAARWDGDAAVGSDAEPAGRCDPYSAGGPVVSPALGAVVVAPLAPLAGISRPPGSLPGTTRPAPALES